MPTKSGRGRRKTRKLRRLLEQKLVQALGDHWKAETPKEQAQQNAIVRRIIKRWKTDQVEQNLTMEDLRSMSPREVALIVTHRNMLSPEPMVSNAAVRNLIAMEAQNQRDEFAKEGTAAQKHLHLHQHQVGSGPLVRIDEIDLSFLSEDDRLELKRRILQKIREKKQQHDNAEIALG